MLQPFSDEMQRYLSQEIIKLSYFVEIDLEPQVCLHSGIGSIEYNGKTYVGVGNLGSVSSIKQTNEIEATSIQLKLSALDSTILDSALTEKFSEKDVRIYAAGLDRDDDHKVVAFGLLFSGFVTKVTGVLGSDNNAITLSISNKIEKWAHGKSDRFSQPSHTLRNPNDNFFKYIAETATMTSKWGNTTNPSRYRY